MSQRTLKDYRALAKIAYGEGSKAVKFLDKKIKESPSGEDEPVLTDESQMIHLIGSLGK